MNSARSRRGKVGKQIKKSFFQRRRVADFDPERHVTEFFDDADERRHKKIESVIERNDIEEFFQTSDEAGRQFCADRGDRVKIVSARPSVVTSVPTAFELNESLSIPVRPPWERTMSPEQVDEQERLAFVQWRRQIAGLENAARQRVITPFEKNLDIWRQLWRVVERSDVVLQIIDARNPLAYRCPSLDAFVHATPPPMGRIPKRKRRTLVLCNKADLLTPEQRANWADYFKCHRIPFLFFSALTELNQLTPTPTPTPTDTDTDTDTTTTPTPTPTLDPQLDESNPEPEIQEQEQDSPLPPVSQTSADTQLMARADIRVLSRDELLLYLLCNFSPKLECGVSGDGIHQPIARQQNSGKQPCLAIGLVGYPNVGKSTVLNALRQRKSVAVGMTPGKTKHLQTHFTTFDSPMPLHVCRTEVLSDGEEHASQPHAEHLMFLLDCPGLVFPSWRFSPAEMLCDGVLRVDEMRDPTEAMALIADRIPKETLEQMYGIRLDYTPEMDLVDRGRLICNQYGEIRGFMTVHGNPDIQRSSRIILKDYIRGKLLYVHPPPPPKRRNAT